MQIGEQWCVMIQSENDLRLWCKKVFRHFGVQLAWQEPGFGGLAGIADMVVSCSNWRLPMELKFWPCNTKGIRTEVRPLQRQYHMLEARAGRKTAFLWATVMDGYSIVFILPGRHVPMGTYDDVIFNSITLWSGNTLKKPEENSVCRKFLDIVGRDSLW